MPGSFPAEHRVGGGEEPDVQNPGPARPRPWDQGQLQCRFTWTAAPLTMFIDKKYNKTPMFWDDIVFKHPEQIDNIPKNAIVMHWGYETEHRFERNCRLINEKGLKFYVCPGTSMWGSFTGRTNNMYFNITNAVESGCEHGAEGFLLTEWGDGGHPQFPCVTYLPLVLSVYTKPKFSNSINAFCIVFGLTFV